MALLANYSAAAFNILPALGEAIDTSGLRSQEIVDLFRPIFLKHEVHQYLTLNLVHRHWTVGQNEKAVTRGNTTKAENTTEILVPSCLVVTPNGTMPYEFFVADHHHSDFTNYLPQAFLDDFSKLVREHDLGKGFGVGFSRYDQPGTYEITEGNINYTFQTDPYPGDDSNIDVAWTYAGENGLPLVHGQCKDRCKAQGTQHVKKHLNT